jgi:hypothetical protein
LAHAISRETAAPFLSAFLNPTLSVDLKLKITAGWDISGVVRDECPGAGFAARVVCLVVVGGAQAL